MKAKRLRALLVAGLLSLAPAVTLTSCGGGGGGGGDGSDNVNNDSGDNEEEKKDEIKDYAYSSMIGCSFKAGSLSVSFYPGGRCNINQAGVTYGNGSWNYKKTGTNKAHISIRNCRYDVAVYPEHSYMTISIEGDLEFSGKDEAYLSYTQSIYSTRTNQTNSVDSGGTCYFSNVK